MSDLSEIHDILKSVTYISWDVHDDVYFKDRYVSGETTNNRINRKFRELEKAITIWLDKLKIPDVINESVLTLYQHHIKAYTALEEFFKIMSEAYNQLNFMENSD